MPFVFERPIRFDEIDAAGYVYFPNVVAMVHEAIEALLARSLPGGYARFVRELRVGIPCVHLQADFSAPLRFGDVISLAISVSKIGSSSVTFAAELSNERGPCAKIGYVVACADLDGPSKRSLPEELRRVFGSISSPP